MENTVAADDKADGVMAIASAPSSILGSFNPIIGPGRSRVMTDSRPHAVFPLSPTPQHGQRLLKHVIASALGSARDYAVLTPLQLHPSCPADFPDALQDPSNITT